MNSTYFKLIIIVTLKYPREVDDVILRTTRVLPFPPQDGMTLVLSGDNDEEHEIVLGPPRYEFASSAFVEYQDDEAIVDATRECAYSPELRESLLTFYKAVGFENITPVRVIEQMRAQA